MNSSVQPLRRIASNLLWTPQGVVRDPLLEVAPDGRVLSVAVCAEPDRQPFTEFYAGLLVPDFPADYRAAFCCLLAEARTPLPELLAALFAAASATHTPISAVETPAAIPAGMSVAAPAETPVAASAAIPPERLPSGCLVVISGLDYDTLRLTAQSQIRLLAGR